MRALSASLIVACLALPSFVQAATLRCENRIVSDGASKADTLMKCGEPMSKEVRTEYVSNSNTVKERTGRSTMGSTRTEEASTEVTVSFTIEEWTYNFGPNRLMQTAVFRNGVLVDVRSGSYGR